MEGPPAGGAAAGGGGGGRGGFRGGFGGRGDREGGRGRGRGGRGGPRGGRGGPGGRGRAGEEKTEWVPVTKLGRLVKDMKIKKIEEIYLFSFDIKEPEIVDRLLPSLKDEVMKITPVQKQTQAGQRTRFKAIVAIGDSNGHIGLGQKVSKEVATAIRGAIIDAKLNVVPVRRGYWGNKMGEPHTVTGKCGSVTVRLIPAPRGTGLVCAPVPKKLLGMAGIQDCWTKSFGSTSTLGNFAGATYAAIRRTYSYLSPDLWNLPVTLPESPLQTYSEHLAKKDKEVSHGPISFSQRPAPAAARGPRA